MRNKSLLQLVVTVASLVPLLAGLAGCVWGSSMLGDQPVFDMSLDSHFRYLSGLLLGIGLGYVSCIKDIEIKTERFLLLTGIVFVGGLARLYGLFVSGIPHHGMIFGLVMELVVTPLLCLWQRQIALKASTLAS